MSVLFFNDITLESSTSADSVLTEDTCLTLEFSLSGNYAGRVNLLSHESESGIWRAVMNPFAVIWGLVGELMLSVSIELGQNERQLLGFIELDGPELYDAIGVAKQYELPLIGYGNAPSLILKTRVLGLDNNPEPTPTNWNPNSNSSVHGALQKILAEACAAYDDFGHYGHMTSLDQAISQFQTVVEIASKDSPKLPDLLNFLGSSLTDRFERLGRLADLDDAIERLKEAIDLSLDSNADKPLFLDNLGSSLQARFERMGNPADIDEAILRKQAAVDLTLDSDVESKARYSNSLGSAFETRFQRFANIPDIDLAISRRQIAVNLTPDEHPDKPRYLNNLGICLDARFKRVGNMDDINYAISLQQAATDLTPDGHPKKPLCLNNLGIFFKARSQRSGSLDDIEKAVSLQQAALDLTPEDDPDKPNRLCSLGLSLTTRFELSGELADINSAISRLKAAVDSHPKDTNFLNNFGHALHIRFRRLGNLADIDNSISQHQIAMKIASQDDPDQPGNRNNLSGALMSRFQRLGNLTDIHNAIMHQQAAVELTPDDHPNKPRYFSNLGNCFLIRHESLGDIEDLDNAISQYHAAVELSPSGHYEKATRLSNLGISFQKRYKLLGDPADISQAISRQKEAVHLTPDGDPRKPGHLANLGTSFKTLFKRSSNIHHLDLAISQQQAAADIVQDGHLEKSPIFLELGRSLRTRHDKLNRPEDANLALSCFSAAAASPVGPPTTRLSAAEAWVSIASLINHQTILEAYECALGLIPLVAWLGLPIQDRHQQLVKIGGIAREAAAAAISVGEYEKALEWLEQGRSIVWTQILQLRTPVDQLRDTNPDLADRLVRVSRLLDRANSQNSSAEGEMTTTEEQGRQYRASTAEWELIIEQVRVLPDFENFLKPLRAPQLVKAAQNGPVVTLNIADERCDALAVIPGFDEVIHIPLPDITSSRVSELRDRLKNLLYLTGIRVRGQRAARKATDSIGTADCKEILAELWINLVKPIIDSLAFSAHPDTLPRIWWCATGPLAFLPIHAAGIYDSDSVDCQLSDYVISSYTPTLSALLHSPTLRTDSSFKLLSVIQPSAPGVSTIPSTREELGCIRNHLSDQEHIVLEGTEGTKRRVMKAMEECNWLHLACHGTQMPNEPTKSALILEDGHLTLEEIISLNLPKAEFAFLSACQTTTGDESLSEEAVHIAGGMLLAGYRGVVATMWSIRDDLAPAVTDEFYSHIMEDLTVELSTRDDCLLMEINHLKLELSFKGRVFGELDLLSRESAPGIWHCTATPLMNGHVGEFMVAISMDLGQNERELLGFMELNGPEPFNVIGSQYEVPLISHANSPSLILKTKIVAAENIQEITQGVGRQGTPRREDTIDRASDNAATAYDEFERHGNIASLGRAISQYETVLEAISKTDPRLPDILSTLGSHLMRRWEYFGRQSDLIDAFVRLEAAVDISSDNHPSKPNYLTNLRNAFQACFERLGDLDNLNQAILRQQAAVDLTSDWHPNRALYLSNLGNSFQIRFLALGDLVDIEQAISRLQAAVALTSDDNPDKAIYLNNLGISLSTRFQTLGNVADVDRAVSSQQMAVDLTPDGHREKPTYLSNLGTSFSDRFRRLGNVVDIDRAIAKQQAAVDLTPDSHLAKPGRLNNLGIALTTRFYRLKNISDINEAITRLQETVDLASDLNPAKPGYLNNLGTSFQLRFRSLGAITDLDRAISDQQRAIDLTPDGHPEKPKYLMSIGVSLLQRFERLGDIIDLDRAITNQLEAVEHTPDSHPNKQGYLSDLGNSLGARFKHSGDPADIDDAISRQQKAVELIPEGHPDRSRNLYNLANSLWTRYRHFSRNEDIEAAISTFSASAMSPVGPPSSRFDSAEAWIFVASSINHHSTLDAYECAINLMPLVAWLGLSIADRHQHLIKIGGVVRNAAAAAISLENYDKALEWLEQGRSIVWTQILQLRTPIDRLRELNPDLANRLVQLSRQLDQRPGEGSGFNGSLGSIEEEGRQYRAVTIEWESTIEQIRSVQGFGDFLRPPRSSKLMKAAQNGPVVILNIAKERCDALAIIPGFDEVIHIPLPNITSDRVNTLQDELKRLLDLNGIQRRGQRAARKATDPTPSGGCEDLLAELWVDLVKPVIDSLAFSAHPDTLPRIWWCATGPLAFLPIHAAGIYEPDTIDSQLSDYVISSYTPTLSALLDSPTFGTESSFKLLSVIQPSAPGVSSIPSTMEELDCIRRHLVDHDHIILEGAEGTKRRVMTEMKECNWLHLACHGAQMPNEPTKSALVLEDGHLTLEEIVGLNLPKAEFAFLSACQTTAGDEELSEEAVHIAGGMLLAGYRGVVATMWSIKDDLAPAVTDGFYSHIVEVGRRPDSKKAAEALHFSVQKLRKKAGISLMDWIPFVHLGI
ncbi:hypothetical protein CPB86DRAFT_869573 [Serendipita vermifera]|nr:hypothetical protein CPB86DRAFT_869573 [Serendipita vermifera]